MSHVLFYAKHPKKQPVLFSKEGTEWMKICTVYNATIQTKNSWILIVGPTCTFCPSILHFLSNPLSLQILSRGKILQGCFQNSEGESAAKSRPHVSQIVSMATELPKLCPPITHCREHKSFSAALSMEGNVLFQFDSFPAKCFCQSEAQFKLRIV